MATVLRTPAIGAPLTPPRLASFPSRASRTTCLSFRNGSIRPLTIAALRLTRRSPPRFAKCAPFAASGDTETTAAEEIQEPQLEESADGAAVAEDSATDDVITSGEEAPDSAISMLLRSYREALASSDESKVAEIEAFLKSIEDEKASLENKVAALSAELSTQRDRLLRISADFDNFRKRTDTERLSLVSNAQGEVVENLLPVLDNFERAKAQIKIETDGEEKINNSYQSIYKQFVEILTSLGVVPVETVGNPFDPLLHEAIMREDSTEYEEGVVIEQYRQGFKLGDRLLRPSMVKVSAGPGPAKAENVEPPKEESEAAGEVTEEGSA